MRIIMTKDLIIREIDSSNKNEINKALSLHNSTFDDNRTIKHWLWEYKGHYPDKFTFAVIEDDDNIVGTQGMIPIFLNIKGKKVLTGKSENTLLHPKYRGRGTLFTECYDHAVSQSKKKGMYCIWGFTALGKVWKKKFRFSVYENVTNEYFLILNSKNAIKEISKTQRKKIQNHFKSILSFGCYLFSLCKISFRTQNKSINKKYKIEKNLRSYDDIKQLYMNLRKKFPDLIHIEQDKKYINWRLYDNPNINFQTYFIYENKSLKGYCYFNLVDDKKTIYLTDLTVQNAEVGAVLLRMLIDRWRIKRIGFIYFIGNDKNPIMVEIINLLKKYGFMKRRSKTGFVVLKNLSYKDNDHLHNIKNWYFNYLWTEGFNL